MGVNDQRPVNLNLFTIRFPITAIVSIIHRITGVLLFFFIPISIWMLRELLHSKDTYNNLMTLLEQPIYKGIVFLGIGAFMYHILAGTRHILMDFGFGEEKEGAKATSVWLFIIYLACLVAIGGWLW